MKTIGKFNSKDMTLIIRENSKGDYIGELYNKGNVKRGKWINRATFEGKDATTYRVMEYFGFKEYVDKLSRVFVARTLGSEPLWHVGHEVKFQFTFGNCNSTWELTLRREEDKYAPFSYALHGRQLTFDGKTPEYPASWSQRYTSMERAFLHVLNHGNDNANIPNRYKSLDQWLNANSDKEHII